MYRMLVILILSTTLPHHLFTAIEKKDNVLCVICFEEIELSKKIPSKILPCKHTFHAPCIQQWLESRSTIAHLCPLCKKAYANPLPPPEVRLFGYHPDTLFMIALSITLGIGIVLIILPYLRHALANYFLQSFCGP